MRKKPKLQTSEKPTVSLYPTVNKDQDSGASVKGMNSSCEGAASRDLASRTAAPR